jgi:hypothetical protein
MLEGVFQWVLGGLGFHDGTLRKLDVVYWIYWELGLAAVFLIPRVKTGSKHLPLSIRFPKFFNIFF